MSQDYWDEAADEERPPAKRQRGGYQCTTQDVELIRQLTAYAIQQRKQDIVKSYQNFSQDTAPSRSELEHYLMMQNTFVLGLPQQEDLELEYEGSPPPTPGSQEVIYDSGDEDEPRTTSSFTSGFQLSGEKSGFDGYPGEGFPPGQGEFFVEKDDTSPVIEEKPEKVLKTELDLEPDLEFDQELGQELGQEVGDEADEGLDDVYIEYAAEAIADEALREILSEVTGDPEVGGQIGVDDPEILGWLVRDSVEITESLGEARAAAVRMLTEKILELSRDPSMVDK